MIVGDGPLKAELVNQARELSIQDSVLFVGYQTMAREIIANFDLLVVPSKSEGFGRTILEAMQAKTPVVATKSGGIPEIVEHEYNGILVDYGNENELRNAMIRLLEDEHLRSKLIQNGYRTVRNRFELKRYASELEMIYMSVSENHNMH
jgi:glycosyltransferase involved in cell wall biosynthesis